MRKRRRMVPTCWELLASVTEGKISLDLESWVSFGVRNLPRSQWAIQYCILGDLELSIHYKYQDLGYRVDIDSKGLRRKVIYSALAIGIENLRLSNRSHLVMCDLFRLSKVKSGFYEVIYSIESVFALTIPVHVSWSVHRHRKYLAIVLLTELLDCGNGKDWSQSRIFDVGLTIEAQTAHWTYRRPRRQGTNI